MLQAIMETHPKGFQWKSPPYEYEYQRKPIDLILGDISLRQQLESGVSLSRMNNAWTKALESFHEWRKPYLLYD